MRTWLHLLVCVVAWLCAVVPVSAEESRERPHLFFGPEDIPRLQERMEHPELAWLWPNVERAARNPARSAPNWSNHTMCAGLAWQLTRDRRYAEPAIEVAMEIAAIPGPWSPTTSFLKHVDLTIPRRTLPLAYAYDMLYDAMSEQQRETIREALREKVFAPYMRALAHFDEETNRFVDDDGHWEWWSTAYFNWNAWVNGDIGLAALATLGDIPEAEQVVEKARASLRFMHPEFDRGEDESGGWDEGPMYWQGSISHLTRFYAALERVKGTDDGFFDLPGVAKTMWYGIDFTTPDGRWVTFQNAPNRRIIDPASVLYYLGKRYEEPQFVRHLDVNAASWHPMPFGILWRPPIPTPEPPRRPPTAWYRDIDWAVLRSGDLFVPFKAGDLGSNHRHFDANNVLIWVRGERMLDYPGRGITDTELHNCVLVNGRGQRPLGSRSAGVRTDSYAPILACGTVGGEPYVVADAAACYEEPVLRAQRHVVLAEEGYVVVLDDLLVPDTAEFTANWHTLHELTKGPGHSAVIESEGVRLHVVPISDAPIRTETAIDPEDRRVFRVSLSGRPRRQWRVFTVFAPDEQPRASAFFENDSVVLSVNGRAFPFEPHPDGGLRYAAGPYEEAPPIGEW